MRDDPIVEEVRRVREDYASQFGFDLRAIAADLRRREQDFAEQLVTFPPKPARRASGRRHITPNP